MKWFIFLLMTVAAANRNMYLETTPDDPTEPLELAAHAESSGRVSDASGELSSDEYAAGLHAAFLGAQWAALTLTNETTRDTFHSAFMRVYAQWSDEYNVSVSLDKHVQCDTMTNILTHYDYYIPDGYNDVVNGWLIYC
jgi:hypothetical protein